VGAAGAVVKHDALHLVAKFGKGGGGGCAGKTRSDNHDLILTLVGGINQLEVGFIVEPFIWERAGRNVGIELSHDE
jgi:hypothetical protein